MADKDDAFGPEIQAAWREARELAVPLDARAYQTGVVGRPRTGLNLANVEAALRAVAAAVPFNARPDTGA